MNKLPSEAAQWAKELKTDLEGLSADVLICAPSTHLWPLHEALEKSAVLIGAQDISEHESGAYTGEVAAAMVKDSGASYVIIGHSERRAYHQENDLLINSKLKKALEHKLTPILCIGESEAQREAGEEKTVVLTQLKKNLAGIALSSAQELVIAYEPIWAIGTGKTATAEDAQTMCSYIRQALKDLYPALAEDIRILYGGSMKPANAGELLAKPDINGGLIGGASLKLADLKAIIHSA